MDKTSIIVIGSCIALLGANWWYTSTQTPPPATPAPQAQVAPAVPTAAPAAQPTTEATPAYVTPATPVPQVLATLTSHDSAGKPVARYSIQDIGGSVKCVDMLGQAINSTKEELRGDVSINGNVPQGIGTLMFRLSNNAEPAYDQTPYSIIPELTNDKQVALFARMGDLLVRKIYSLAPLQHNDRTVEGNAYVLNLTVDVQNVGSIPLSATNWGLYAGGMSQINHSEGSIYTHYIMLENGDFCKENRGSFDPFFGSAKSRIYSTDNKKLEWVGTMSQYYSTVVMPDANSGNNAWYAAPTRYKLPVTNEEVDGVEMGAGIPDFTLAPKTENMPGGVRSLSYKIFTGPKLNLMLEDMTHDIPKIEQIMDYGWLYLISYPMNWLINIFHSWFGNWGWAIVAMTFVVRLIIWPLYRKSYMSMKRMSLLQPMMKELKEKYPNDQQKVSMEMMNLYRQYGISPFGGCPADSHLLCLLLRAADRSRAARRPLPGLGNRPLPDGYRLYPALHYPGMGACNQRAALHHGRLHDCHDEDDAAGRRPHPAENHEVHARHVLPVLLHLPQRSGSVLDHHQHHLHHPDPHHPPPPPAHAGKGGPQKAQAAQKRQLPRPHAAHDGRTAEGPGRTKTPGQHAKCYQEVTPALHLIQARSLWSALFYCPNTHGIV